MHNSGVPFLPPLQSLRLFFRAGGFRFLHLAIFNLAAPL